MSPTLYIVVPIIGAAIWILVRLIQNRRSPGEHGVFVRISGFESRMKSRGFWEVGELDDFTNHYQKVAKELGQLGLSEAQKEIEGNLFNFEAPMSGYFQRMAIITINTLKRHKRKIPKHLRQELEIGYNTCARLCGIEGYVA